MSLSEPQTDSDKDFRARGFREILAHLGQPDALCRLGGSDAPTFLAKSPGLVYQVLVAKEGLYANPAHPYRYLTSSYTQSGLSLMGLASRKNSWADLNTSILQHLDRFPVFSENGTVDVVAHFKVWSAKLLILLLWREPKKSDEEISQALLPYIQDISQLEKNARFDLADAAVRTRFLELLFASPSFKEGALQDPRLCHAILRTFLNAYNALAISLAWSLVVLARDQSLQNALRAKEFSALDFAQEILRLYPPAWVFQRQLLQSDHLGGMHLPAGTIVLISPLATQRDPQYWQQADQFVPSRERKSSPRELRFFPFGGGERICPAARHVPKILAVVIENVVASWRADLDGDVAGQGEGSWEGRISLHPPPGIRLRLERA